MRGGVLFVHNNFPGQFRDLAETLVSRGVACCAISQPQSAGLPGVRRAVYALAKGTTEGIFPLAVRAEADLIRAHGAWRAAKALRDEGWDPAVIVGHPGWGETVLLREVFPAAKQVAFAEFFYHARGFDVGFDEEFMSQTEDGALRVRAKNLAMSLAYAEADLIVSPTEFQASTLPQIFQNRVHVIHEGVDVEAIRPGAAEPFELADGRIIAPGTPVITHVNNNLEPLRGMHIFARALPRLLAEVPSAQVLIVGGATKNAYGGTAPDDQTWRDVAFRGVKIDPARVHFLGRVPHERMLAALRLGSAHVYYTYPFVLSWSLAEAMASGCYVIGSDTAPLHDAIDDGVSGLLLPFFDVDALSGAMIEACHNPAATAPLRAAARAAAVERFDRAKGRAAWLTLLTELGLEIPG
jgi:glycosyltransferase involved in cell wall biosynthesis